MLGDLLGQQCPTLPAPTMSVRSANDGRHQNSALVTQRSAGVTTIASAQNTISDAIGAAVAHGEDEDHAG